MPGEEVTGLHAFDDIDPISTVSALNVMEPAPVRFGAGAVELEEDEPATTSALPPSPLRSSLPPPPPRRAVASSLPPPPARAAVASSLPPPPPRGGALASSLPPPPARAAIGGRSLPPPPALRGKTVQPITAPSQREDTGEIDQDTKVVPNAFEKDPDFAPTSAAARVDTRPAIDAGFEAFDDGGDTSVTNAPGDESTTVSPNLAARSGGIDDTALLELSATTVATNIDMEWDEEEVETKLRDGSSPSEPPHAGASAQGSGRPSPFAPQNQAVSVVPFGQPSPFAPRHGMSVRPQAPTDEWEDEDEALTRALPDGQGFAAAYGATSSQNVWPTPRVSPMPETLAGDAPFAEANNNLWAWLGFAGVALVAFAVAAWAWRAGRTPATVTLVVEPKDSVVTIDGRVLEGQTSPFTIQPVPPNVEHVIEVRHDGYTSQTQRIRPKAGEVLAVPSIELVQQRIDTGFALSSSPAGASVFVDAHKLEQLTPVRVADLAPGLHAVRLEYGTAYQPWETQVSVASGQVIELPTAKLVPASPSGTSLVGAGVPAAPSTPRAEASPVANAESSSSSGHHHHHHAEAAPAMQPQPLAMPKAPPMQMKAAPMRAQMAPAPVAAAPVPAAGGSMGVLRINSRPWAQVYVDGRLVGNTPLLNFPVKAGHHKLKLVNPQLSMSKSMNISVTAGQPTTQIVQLY